MTNINKNQFTQFHLSKEIIDNLNVLQYQEPTPIQSEVIPPILLGRDVVAKSKTGSGKTAAFGIPICETTTWEGRYPQVLVLEPTRELAEQVRHELFCIGRSKRLKVPAVFGGFPIDKQIQTLRQKTHIVVGTPGRIMDHLRRGTLNLSEIKQVVIDEADLMLAMGFIDEVKQILDQLPDKKQLMLFSATIDHQIDELIETHMSEPVRISAESDEVAASEIQQLFYHVDRDDKFDSFMDILAFHNPDESIIFCATKEMVQVLYQKLKRERISCVLLHGDQDQRERMRTMEQFAQGKYRFLVATDLAARGIDFSQITHVFNYDFPTGKEAYVHRIGRTGRNKKTGTAISLVTEDDTRMKLMVEEYTGISIEELTCPTKEEIDAKKFYNKQRKATTLKPVKGAGFKRNIMKLSIGGGRKSKIRAVDIVGTICNIEGITGDDIGIIDVRDSLTHVEILHNKGSIVLEALQTKPIKGKIRKVRKTR